MSIDFKFNNRYSDASDQEIVSWIVTAPYNEEAAAYLLYNRYSPMLRNICMTVYGNLQWYEDCLAELFCYLRGDDCNWRRLASFQWKSKLSTWMRRTAYNRFLEIKPRLIEKLEKSISIDDTAKGTFPIFESDTEIDEETRLKEVLLLEAVGMLRDDDQKFIILKTLQGYKSEDIAILLAKKWEKDGKTVRNNHGETVMPTADYVNVRRQRAKNELKEIVTTLFEEREIL